VHTAAPALRHWVGTPVARQEDQALLTGRARFMDDLSPLPGLKHAAILRSPYPHARIGAIDVAPVRSLSGVLGVVTVAVGAMILTGIDHRVETDLVGLSPAWLSDVTTRY